MLHQRTASTLSRDSPTNAGVTSSTSGNGRAQATSPSKDKDKIRQWTFPRPSSTSPTNSLTGSGSGSAGAGASASTGLGLGLGGPGAGQVHGQSSATSPTAWDRSTKADPSKHELYHGSSPTPQSTPRFSYPSSPPPSQHRSNASIAYASTSASKLSLAARLNPLLLAKVLYSNLRRSSLNDIFYGLVFVGSLLVFFRALSGQGYSPHAALAQSPPTGRRADKPHGRGRVWPVLTDQQGRSDDVRIPKQFLPLEDDVDAPADVYQPHGDSSHDRGADFLRDSPEDSDLDDDRTHQVPRRRGREALFGKHSDEHATAHAEADRILSSEVPTDDDEEDADDDDDDAPALPAEAASHEDSFNVAHPLHIIAEDAGDLSPPDFFQPESPPPPPEPPVVIMADEPHDNPAQAIGDSFRRPAGLAGIEEMAEQRAAMGRERKAAAELETETESEDVDGEIVRRQRRVRDMR